MVIAYDPPQMAAWLPPHLDVHPVDVLRFDMSTVDEQ